MLDTEAQQYCRRLEAGACFGLRGRLYWWLNSKDVSLLPASACVGCQISGEYMTAVLSISRSVHDVSQKIAYWEQERRKSWHACRLSWARGKNQKAACHPHRGWGPNPHSPHPYPRPSCAPPLLPPKLLEQALSPCPLLQSWHHGHKPHHSCHRQFRVHHSWLLHRCVPQLLVCPCLSGRP